MLGESFSAVDIYLFMLSTWLSDDCGHPALAEFANVMRVVDKVLQRPSVSKVHPALHGVN
jgi:glutathione S-transferase